MAKDSKVVYGASGKTNVLTFEPENLHLVTDKTHPLYDERSTCLSTKGWF
jgi:ParB family chromosome partitioning protein